MLRIKLAALEALQLSGNLIERQANVGIGQGAIDHDAFGVGGQLLRRGWRTKEAKRKNTPSGDARQQKFPRFENR